MYRWEKTMREERYKYEKENPSFSSILLDKIYRSIDEGEKNNEDLKFSRETITTRQSQSKINEKGNRDRDKDEEMGSFRRACLIEKWIDKKNGEKVSTQTKLHTSDFDRKLVDSENVYFDQEALFFSSTSISSDSSSGGFSSSDTESMYITRSKAKASCFAPTRIKPVKTSVVSTRPKKTEQKQSLQRGLVYDHHHKEYLMFDDYDHHNGVLNDTQKIDESLIKSKSRALKIYNNLKKVKQPISPGGRFTSFINSLFSAGNAKKSCKNPSSISIYNDASYERKSKSKSVQASSACSSSSSSSFSRSCLSKNSSSTREKLQNGVKRAVRFYPVSVVVDEDSRPCGHKSLYEEDKEELSSSLMAVSVPTVWKIGKSSIRKAEEESKGQVLEKSTRRVVEEVGKEFLRDYRQNQIKSELFKSDFGDFDDDVASDASSDLFELDHLNVIGNNGKYQENDELPVYETTHVYKNRIIYC